MEGCVEEHFNCEATGDIPLAFLLDSLEHIIHIATDVLATPSWWVLIRTKS